MKKAVRKKSGQAVKNKSANKQSAAVSEAGKAEERAMQVRKADEKAENENLDEVLKRAVSEHQELDENSEEDEDMWENPEEDEEYEFEEESRKKQPGKLSVIVRKMIFCISLGVFSYAAVGLAILLWGYYSSEKEYDDLIGNAIVVGTNAPEETKQPQTSENGSTVIDIPNQPEKVPVYPIEVKEDYLRAVNQDYVLWIAIPGTSINYPVVQGEDNNHYLRYTFRNTENVAGSVYLDYRTPKEKRLEVFNTIFIGHNRQDGTMFSDLLKYQDESFRDENPYIYLIMNNVEYVYEIYAFYELEPASIVYNPTTTADRYLPYVEQHNSYQRKIDVTEEDNIITLYTCNEDSSGRFLCHAVLREVYNLDEYLK